MTTATARKSTTRRIGCAMSEAAIASASVIVREVITDSPSDELTARQAHAVGQLIGRDGFDTLADRLGLTRTLAGGMRAHPNSPLAHGEPDDALEVSSE